MNFLESCLGFGGVGKGYVSSRERINTQTGRQEEDLWPRKQNTFEKQKVEKIWRNGVSRNNTLEISHLQLRS